MQWKKILKHLKVNKKSTLDDVLYLKKHSVPSYYLSSMLILLKVHGEVN